MAENDFQFRRTRGGNIAPWQPLILSDFHPPDPPDSRTFSGYQADFARAAPRAAASAYSLDQRIVGVQPAAAEDLPAGRIVAPEIQVIPPRAANPAYLVATGMPFVEDLVIEKKNGDIDTTPRPKPRAPASAYRPTHVTFVPPELLPPGQVAVSNPFPSPRLGAAESYRFRVIPVPPDPNIPILPRMGEAPFVVLPRRAGAGAYRLSDRNGPQIPEEAAPLSVQLCPRFARGYARAARHAYLPGGGVVDIIRDGAPRPGCPYRPGFPDAGQVYFSRVDEGTSYVGRADEGSTYPTRVDECH